MHNENLEDVGTTESRDSVKDRYNRPILSLRISLTNRCNLNCLYCHHDGMLPSDDEMTVDEIYKILKIAKKLGIRKIRYSGGEPLLRMDIVQIIEKTASLDFDDISITTNGILLGKYAEDLKDAGLKRVNVSFDSLNNEVYHRITSKNLLNYAKEGIIRAAEVGLNPVKINMVIMNDINNNEIKDMFEFSKEHNLVLQLIELIKSDSCEDNTFSDEHYFPLTPLEKDLEDIADKTQVRKFMQNRKKFFIDDGEIEIVRPVDNTNFCQNCTRLRLTPEGKLKPCLLINDNLVDIVTPIRQGKSDIEIEKLFLDGINKRKPFHEKVEE
ncbi:MAG: GTP 3',8-cyclase MoaA [Methanobrevibacter sp.]|jgi:cyclic pyranopterin phosphate synthase|nr:GTP 3',8-cyclase MoaA [Candidatus Methanoflexus mossambicus]